MSSLSSQSPLSALSPLSPLSALSASRSVADASDPFGLAARAAQELARITGLPSHDVLVVLGSGWSAAADAFGSPDADENIASLPGFFTPVAVGHSGRFRSYDVFGTRMLCYLGRTHLYEGHGANAVAHPIRAASAAGCRMAILTNANGSLNPAWSTGTAVLISDHLNPTFATPLAGAQFVDLSDCWDAGLRTLSKTINPAFEQGVYAMVPGPSYQTLAETAMLRALGADIVGMSTVVEAIAAREANMQLLGISIVTTREGTGEVIDPNQVVATASAAAKNLGGVIVEIIEGWAKTNGL